MYNLERTKKVIIVMFCLSAASLVLTFIEFAAGGAELLMDGFMNNPTSAILMFVFAGIFVVSLLAGIGFKALSKDIAEELKFLNDQLREKSDHAPVS